MAAPTLDSPPAGVDRLPVDPVAQTLALLQPWIDFVPKPQRRLGVFIFLALLVHIGVFFFIRIDTSRAELQHRTRIHVTVETAPAALEASAPDAFWDGLADPRLYLLPTASLHRLSTGEPLLDFSAIDSSIGPQQLPAPLMPRVSPAGANATLAPDQEVAGDMLPVRQPFHYDETLPTQNASTSWQWDPALTARQPSNVPPLPSPVSNTDLSPTQLLLAVDGSGTVEHVLLEDTSQKPELDQQAILAARKIRFRPDPAGLTWGRITIYWHDTAPPREVILPTPSTP